MRAAIDDPGAYTHDGLYLRAAVGLGFVHDTLKYNGQTVLGLAPSGDAQGASFQGDVALGGAIVPGFVLAGQIYVEQVANPGVTLAGTSSSSDVSVGTLTMFGPMIDWYPNAHEGFHFGGMLGGARITMKDSANHTLDNQPIGGGGTLFVGYEWWTGEQWSAGVLGQFTGASMHDGSTNITHNWSSAGLAFAVTYN